MISFRLCTLPGSSLTRLARKGSTANIAFWSSALPLCTGDPSGELIWWEPSGESIRCYYICCICGGTALNMLVGGIPSGLFDGTSKFDCGKDERGFWSGLAGMVIGTYYTLGTAFLAFFALLRGVVVNDEVY